MIAAIVSVDQFTFKGGNAPLKNWASVFSFLKRDALEFIIALTREIL